MLDNLWNQDWNGSKPIKKRWTHNLKKVKLSSARKEAVSIKKLNLFMKNLSKFGYPEKSIIVKNKKKYNKLLVKAFQRRFRPELINGKIDQECSLILHNLLNNKV